MHKQSAMYYIHMLVIDCRDFDTMVRHSPLRIANILDVALRIKMTALIYTFDWLVMMLCAFVQSAHYRV